jgi:16S rRNA G966 N2-methylase RsmD
MAIDYFQTFDFSLLDTQDFKEDSVRETIILPLLHALGYGLSGLNQIIRSKALLHPFVNIGSQKRKVTIIPDYLLTVEHKYAWVLDAKAPDETIQTGSNVEQAYSYAIHPDIRAPIFALCNGREFIAFHVDQKPPLVYIQMSEINRRWQTLYDLLSPRAFKPKADFEPDGIIAKEAGFEYKAIKPLPEITTLKKQSAKRHFGVHPYFTKQVWNVVQEYIKNFSQPGDTILDPFGGSGVTAVEALILGRKAIHIDINPLSIFLVKNLIAPVNLDQLTQAFNHIKQQFLHHAPQTDKDIEQALATYPYPQSIKLPENSDVETVKDLFTPRQLAQLAYLKHLIKQVKDEDLQGTLLLMFSGLLNKVNLTYHASEGRSEGRGDSGVFRYYRYRLAPKPAFLNMMEYFESRLKKVIAAKKEIAPHISSNTLQYAQIYKGTATDLQTIPDQSVDYIYTDPPYGKKIQYLDLSIMWNA